MQENILQQLLTSEIHTRLLTQAAEEQQIEISDEEVDKVIAELLEQEGIETEEAYEEVVQASGMTIEEYEAEVKQDLIRFRFVEAEKGAPVITEEEIEQRYEAQDTEQELDDVREQIVAELEAGKRQAAATELIDELMAEADIEIFIEQD
ncbi:foldase protein PrsA precursor [Bacillus sp. JCM 19046]|nr:foldase protein PrsA precursor [Bacillus sp. JCM 19046]